MKLQITKEDIIAQLKENGYYELGTIIVQGSPRLNKSNVIDTFLHVYVLAFNDLGLIKLPLKTLGDLGKPKLIPKNEIEYIYARNEGFDAFGAVMTNIFSIAQGSNRVTIKYTNGNKEEFDVRPVVVPFSVSGYKKLYTKKDSDISCLMYKFGK